MLPRNNLHKYSIFLLFSVLFCFPAFAQKNYIRVYVPQAEISPGTVLNSKNSLISTSYYDSAGRLIQTVQQGITPLGKDIANHIVKIVKNANGKLFLFPHQMVYTSPYPLSNHLIIKTIII